MKNLTFVAIALLAVACNTSSEAPKDAPKDAPKPAQSGGDTKPVAEQKAETKATKIDQVGLSADLPADATVSKGMSENSAMVSTGATTLTISVAKDTDPKTVEQGKSSALLGDKGRGLKGDKTADGWVVTWENTGSAGDNYWLTMRREIGGKGYMCETMQSNEDQRKAAIAVCNSLKP